MPHRPGNHPAAGLLSRKRTADLLRRLRSLMQQNRMLKADIEAAERGELGQEQKPRGVRRRRAQR